MRQVCGIDVCDICVDKMLTLHVATNPVKTLCPFCFDKKDHTEKCDYCDIKGLGDIYSGI